MPKYTTRGCSRLRKKLWQTVGLVAMKRETQLVAHTRLGNLDWQLCSEVALQIVLAKRDRESSGHVPSLLESAVPTVMVQLGWPGKGRTPRGTYCRSGKLPSTLAGLWEWGKNLFVCLSQLLYRGKIAVHST